MTLVEDITRELADADEVVESTFGPEGMHRYALEAGARICAIPAVRAARVDSAELISFIGDAVEARPHQGYAELASAIASRFGLVEVAR